MTIPSTAKTTTALSGWGGLAPDPRREEQLAALWAMTSAERVHAMRAGALSRDQLFAWVGRYPGQCPLVNGEWEFIALTMGDLDDD